MKLSAPIYRLKQKAKRLSQDAGLPLYEALDRVAAAEGLARWSLLASKAASRTPAEQLYDWLEPGELLLLGARPGQGKTLMALQLASQAALHGHRATFFTLEYTERQVRDRLRRLDAGSFGESLEIDCSDNIDADYIARKLETAAPGSLVVIDYLQLLDQKRDQPSLEDQVRALRSLARERRLKMVFVSQVSRSYEMSEKPFPDMDDVRLPNPLDLGYFEKACFMNGGALRFGKAA